MNGTKMEFPTVTDHIRTFDRYVLRAEQLLKDSDAQSAATFCQVAAEYAWRNHVGLFYSNHLEALLSRVSQVALKPVICTASKVRTGNSVRRVLHVMTEAYSMGGHTRMAWRWMERDTHRSHSLFLTRQVARAIPSALSLAVKRSGGEVYRADIKRGGLINRAAALQQLAARSDVVVLHSHPYDILPALAFSQAIKRPPVILMNHADHVFWVGVNTSDIVAHFRHSGIRLSINRRAVDPKRCALIPIPISPAERSMSKPKAKRMLGLSETDIVLLSIASQYKYKGHSGINFLEATGPILSRCNNAILLIVGPSANDLRLSGDFSTNRRIHLYGHKNDCLPFYQAADIYLDSLPAASITSLLEAGSFGIPLVSYCPHPPSSEILCADDPALISNLLRVENSLNYHAVVTGLISDTQTRASIGYKTREEVCAVHITQWPEYLEKLYVQTASVHPLEIPQARRDQIGECELDERLVRLHREWGISRKITTILGSHYRLLPLKTRTTTWAKHRKHGFGWMPDFLFPDWLFTLLKCIIFNIARRFKT